MLAGYSTLCSPRHRLRSESSTQFQGRSANTNLQSQQKIQSCHFQSQDKFYALHQGSGSMSTKRLDLPCNFSRKEAPRSQSARAVSLSVENSIENKGNCSLRSNTRIPSLITTAQSSFWVPTTEGRGGEIGERLWEKGKGLKRYSEQSSLEQSCINRAKRKKSSSTPDDTTEGGRLSVCQLGSGDFWFSKSESLTHGLDLPLVPFSSSTEGEGVYFAPAAILSPLPLLKNAWVESVVTEISDKGDHKDAATSKEPKTRSSSSTSETQSFSHKDDGNSSDNETGNGTGIPYQLEGAEVTCGENVQTEQQGFELVRLLVDCAAAVSSNNVALINPLLLALGQIASPEGTPIHRIASYFTEALALRVTKLWPQIFHLAPRELDQSDSDAATGFRLLNHISPIPKFLHFTSNEMILRAFEGKERVHIIDFDLKQGLQWPPLFQSLASRPNPPTHVRITGIGESKQELQDAGDRLAGFAEALNLPFEFHAVVDKLEDVRLWMLHVKEKETVAVNCILQMHKVLYDDNGIALRGLLSLIHSTKPDILLMAEQEADHNDSQWEMRFSNSLKYYSAIFDSIDTSLPLDSPARIKVEEMFAREIRNIVACEGLERIERHEKFGNWRRFMEENGFRCMGIEEREVMQSRMLLKMFSCESYSVEKQGDDGGGLTLSWLEQPLYTVSAWAPIDVAGSSSSVSQAG